VEHLEDARNRQKVVSAVPEASKNKKIEKN
jgi:hypothetical protein